MFSKNIKELFTSLKGEIPDIEISGISLDSQKIRPGNMFVALSGKKFDGRNYINDVISKGARCC